MHYVLNPTDSVASPAAQLKVPGVTEKVNGVSPGNIVGGGTVGPSAPGSQGVAPWAAYREVHGDELGEGQGLARRPGELSF